MKRKDKVERTLAKHWPPQNVRVICDDCGKKIVDVLKHNDINRRVQAAELTSIISIRSEKHIVETGHESVTINIDKEPEPVRKIDATIEVNDGN